MKTITFKSTPKYFRKEYLGLKSNTIRKSFDKKDIREEVLKEFVYKKLNILYIEIVNSETYESFKRKVSDVSIWENVYIISWF